jgi:hypothetical protein
MSRRAITYRRIPMTFPDRPIDAIQRKTVARDHHCCVALAVGCRLIER